MPRPSGPSLDPHQTEILQLLEDGKSRQDILLHLYQQYQVQLSLRTLSRWLTTWKIQLRRKNPDSPELRSRIQELYFTHNLNDENILYFLQKEGFDISSYHLGLIRRDMGLYRRDDPNYAQTRAAAYDRLSSKTIEAGRLLNYGRTFAATELRRLGINIRRDDLWKVYKEVIPAHLQRQFADQQVRPREFQVKGPDLIWSTDGYEKLRPFGFEIYAAIDAYSRQIMWFYCGLSSTTAWSIATQYIAVLRARPDRTMPRFIRSDHGVETGIFAAIHFWLASNRRNTDTNEFVRFSETFFFGASTKNVKIESWWGQLHDGAVLRFRVCLPLLSLK